MINALIFWDNKKKLSLIFALVLFSVSGLFSAGGQENTGKSGGAASSQTDMVVMAFQIDDLITFDPAEVYELTGMEMMANIYDRLLYFPSDDIENPQPGLAESWDVAEDGKTYTFKIREGATFHSGNPVTADDAAWSFQRVIKMNKGPAFIIAELGFTPENVDDMIKAVDSSTLEITTGSVYSPSYVINCLCSGVGSIVDKTEALSHEENGDWGNGWLKTADAGSGPFKLTTWKANELVILDRYDDYWKGAASITRVALKHVPESASQRLMFEKGDVAIARNLSPGDIAALSARDDTTISSIPQGAIYYLGLNQKNPYLSQPEVREALKWLVDYKGIEQNVLKGTRVVHQTFLPAGVLGAIDENPYTYNVAKAKELLKAAGLEDGFKVTMDVTNAFPTNVIAEAIQANFAEAGIELEILPGDNKQTLTKYRAREHDIYIGRWSPDYADPNSNTQGFAWNPDNSDDSSYKLLAWRNSWDIPEMTAKAEEALKESDTEKRKAMYIALQREHLEDSPFVILYQDILVVAEKNSVSGFSIGPSSDYIYYKDITIK